VLMFLEEEIALRHVDSLCEGLLILPHRNRLFAASRTSPLENSNRKVGASHRDVNVTECRIQKRRRVIPR